MCRLYGLYATHPTQADCALLDAQNAVINQAQGPAGHAPVDGWGLGVYSRDGTTCRRQVDPAGKSKRLRADAMETRGTALLAHLRTATVGEPSGSNTHPFRYQQSMLAHRGTLGAFRAIRRDILGALPPARRRAIHGTTDSEHIFQLLLERHRQVPDRSMSGSLRVVLQNLIRWSTAADPSAELAVTLLWVENGRLAASRYNRPLYALERTSPLLCPRCGRPHAHPSSRDDYRAALLASEPLTDEDWVEVPTRSLVSVDETAHIEITPLEKATPVSWLRTGT